MSEHPVPSIPKWLKALNDFLVKLEQLHKPGTPTWSVWACTRDRLRKEFARAGCDPFVWWLIHGTSPFPLENLTPEIEEAAPHCVISGLSRVPNYTSCLTDDQRDLGLELNALHRATVRAAEDRVQQLEREKAAAEAATLPPAKVIWSHGDRAYSRDKINSFVVTLEENNVLQAFLKSGKAMETRHLVNSSGVTNVSRTIGGLCEGYGGVFDDAIRTPHKGRKGTGGYFILVRKIGS
jgi:hypothetical protein